MKKIILLTALSLSIGFSSFAQYFQASFTNVNNVVTFKLKPAGGNITSAIGYIEIAFRYDTTVTASFPITNITPNTAAFPGLVMSQRQDYDAGKYKYIRYLFTSTIPSATYTSGTEYDLFSITLASASSQLATLELANDLTTAPNDPNDYIFFIIAGDGATPLVDPAVLNATGTASTNPTLYGPGRYVSGTGEFVPLTNVPVPVKFTGFSAIKQDDNALLNWAVQNESSSTDHYEIERSFNGTDFTNVASVTAKSNGTLSSSTYNYADSKLSLLKSSGVIYYRIEQVDKDGHVTYTEIKAIRMARGLLISAFPNPAKSSVSISANLDEDANLSLHLTDASGKLIQQTEVHGTKGLNVTKLSLNGLAPGSYLLKVNTGSEIKTLSIVKE